MSSTQAFNLIQTKALAVPIIISIPHVGTSFPPDVENDFKEEHVDTPKDTDWHVDQLYGFSQDLGITVLKSTFSRYVIDLNRPLDGKSLYTDGRQETKLVSEKNFDGIELYKKGKYPDQAAIMDRIKRYYKPYHDQLSLQIEKLRQKFDNILVFEAHSIRRHVPLINPLPIADLTVGDQNQTTCRIDISQTLLRELKEKNYQVAYNKPFMGGFNTRYWGQPQNGIHAIQLEIAQDIYMNEQTFLYEKTKAQRLSNDLKNVFESLINTMRLS